MLMQGSSTVIGSNILSYNSGCQENYTAIEYIKQKQLQLQNNNKRYTDNNTKDNPKTEINIVIRCIKEERFFIVYIKDILYNKTDNISLLHYCSPDKAVYLNGIIDKDGNYNTDPSKAISVDHMSLFGCIELDAFICRHMACAWLLGYLTPKDMRHKEDLWFSQMVRKNGYTEEGANQALSEFENLAKSIIMPVFEHIGSSLINPLDCYNKIFNDLQTYLSEEDYEKLKKFIDTYRKDDISSLKKRTTDFFKGLSTMSCLVSIFSIVLKNNPINNDRYYSFSENSFPDLLYTLCNDVYNKPDNSTESFMWMTSYHCMGLIIKKRIGGIKIRFYDPNDSGVVQKIFIVSPEDAYNIPVSRLLSENSRKNYFTQDLQDMPTSILAHIKKNDEHLMASV